MVALERVTHACLRLTPMYVVLIAVKVGVNRAEYGLNRVNNYSYLVC